MTVTSTDVRLDIQKVTSRIGARVSGVDITKPLGPETVAAIRTALRLRKGLKRTARGSGLVAKPGARLGEVGAKTVGGIHGVEPREEKTYALLMPDPRDRVTVSSVRWRQLF